jgi:hypothetical protein
MVVIIPGIHVGIGDSMIELVGVSDPVAVGVALPPLCGHPPAGRGVPMGLALAGEPESTTPARRPLVMTLAGVVTVTLASIKQLASPKRSSVKAKAYPSQPVAPQQAMRQAPSEETASGASERGAPMRSVRGSMRKREGGQAVPGVPDGDAVDVGEPDGSCGAAYRNGWLVGRPFCRPNLWAR